MILGINRTVRAGAGCETQHGAFETVGLAVSNPNQAHFLLARAALAMH